MNFKRRGRKATALIALSALTLTACGGSPDSSNGGNDGNQITLEFPTWQAQDESFAPWWKELVSAYEEEHPDVSIDFYQIPFESYVDQMTTRFAAGDEPEIVHLPSRNVAEFADRGWLEPLDNRLAETDILETWTPLQEEMVWDDKNYGVLLLGYGYTLFYNEQLLENAGVDVPTTPQELAAAAEAITTDDIYGFGATTRQNPDNYTELASFVVGSGATLATANGEWVVDSPEVIEAMDQYREVLSYAPAGIQSQQRNELFLNGQIAMLIDGPFFLPQLESAPADVREHLKVAAPPFANVPGGASNSLHMPAGLDEETSQAVWEFIELAASPEWQQRYTEITGVPAPREGSVTEEALASNPQLELFQKVTNKAESIYPQAPEHRTNFGKISSLVGEAAIQLISSDVPTEEIAAQLQQELEALGGNS